MFKIVKNTFPIIHTLVTMCSCTICIRRVYFVRILKPFPPSNDTFTASYRQFTIRSEDLMLNHEKIILIELVKNPINL